MKYYRPVPMTDPFRPDGAVTLAGGWCWFDRVEVMERGASSFLVGLSDIPDDVLARLTSPRASLAGLDMGQPRLMGILNVTPDSFSDGGLFLAPEAALGQARRMAEAGADILDIGGESTRPGAALVATGDEIARTAPIIAALAVAGFARPVSIDTRKAEVASAALSAGAMIVNDVAALGFDAAMAAVVAKADAPVVLMHAKGAPATMQDDPRYGDVLLDVYDYLADRVAVAEAAGISRSRIVVDPGIGFGKTAAHNLALLRRLSLFHGLGCPILLGASRKRFIGAISGEESPERRVPGSLAVALHGVGQGVQILRVHDVRETRAVLALWQATRLGDGA